MPHGHRRRGDLEVKAEINVTSMVDVAFTLLIIFIITMPILQGGIEVAVPQAAVNPLTAQDNALLISVTRDGEIFMGETLVPREDLQTVFEQLVSATRPDVIHIKGDSLTDYGPVMQLIALASQSGINFGLIGVRPPERR